MVHHLGVDTYDLRCAYERREQLGSSFGTDQHGPYQEASTITGPLLLTTILDCTAQPLIFKGVPSSFLYMLSYFAPSFTTIFVGPAGQFGRNAIPVPESPTAHLYRCQYRHTDGLFWWTTL